MDSIYKAKLSWFRKAKRFDWEEGDEFEVPLRTDSLKTCVAEKVELERPCLSNGEKPKDFIVIVEVKDRFGRHKCKRLRLYDLVFNEMSYVRESTGSNYIPNGMVASFEAMTHSKTFQNFVTIGDCLEFVRGKRFRIGKLLGGDFLKERFGFVEGLERLWIPQFEHIGENTDLKFEPHICYSAYPYGKFRYGKNIHIPEGHIDHLGRGLDITNLGPSIFRDRKEIETVDLPNTIVAIGEKAFRGCSRLKAINLSECSHLKIIGGYAFGECGSLTDLELPYGLETIGPGAFMNCDGLTRIVIPESVKTIGMGAFCDCANLSEVVIGNQTILEGAPFKGCPWKG